MSQATRAPFCLGALLLTLAVSTAAAAQPVGDDLKRRIDELFVDAGRSDAPGQAVAVIKDGEVVYENAFGMADLERGVALTTESVFEIGSVSKQFTAMCILLLENDGKLSLDDDVRTWIPELPVYERTISLRHLLHHTSGIRDVETLLPLVGVPWFNYYSEAQTLDLITRQQGLNFPPGEQYLYSNSGYTLLAQVVREVSGVSLREFARQRIFEPLGMAHTEFWDDPELIIEGRALPYARDEEGEWVQALWNLPFAGPSGVYTTLRDLARWDANFYDNQLGGGAELIERMTTPGVLENGETLDYAAGLVLDDYRDFEVVAHGGAWMGYRASMIRLPEERLTVVILSNASRIAGRTQAVADFFLPEEPGDAQPEQGTGEQATEELQFVDLPTEALEIWEGTYWNEDDQLLRTIEVRDGSLRYVRTSGEETELGALDDRRFVMIGPSVHVDVVFEGGSGPERTMTVTVGEDESLVFTPVPEASGQALERLAGSYWSAELDRELQLAVVDGELEASWADEARRVPVQQIKEGEFLAPGFVSIPWNDQDVRLVVKRSKSGAVEGLSLSCDMVRGVYLERVASPS